MAYVRMPFKVFSSLPFSQRDPMSRISLLVLIVEFKLKAKVRDLSKPLLTKKWTSLYFFTSRMFDRAVLNLSYLLLVIQAKLNLKRQLNNRKNCWPLSSRIMNSLKEPAECPCNQQHLFKNYQILFSLLCHPVMHL